MSIGRIPITREESPESFSDTTSVLLLSRTANSPRNFSQGPFSLPTSTNYMDDPETNKSLRRIFYSLCILIMLSWLVIITWLALVVTVIGRLEIPSPSNGLRDILDTWRAASKTKSASPLWLPNFSNGVKPVPCHSHNDYWHRIPLYEALAAGCVSVEADIWLRNTTDHQLDLFVGHEARILTPSRTLRSLYLDPLENILDNQNKISTPSRSIDNQATISQSQPMGVFDMAPNTSLILLLDFKTDGASVWPLVMSQLEPLRKRNWLSYWSAQDGFVARPVTIVGTGNTPFELIQSNATRRDIFYDAPLDELSTGLYNRSNSFYASISLKDAVGLVRQGHLSPEQERTIEEQLENAKTLDLLSRYWDTPSWPVSWRNRVWDQLVRLGVGMLNVDDLAAASRWDWNMCVVAGIVVCD